MEDLSASADGIIISLRRADADLSAVMHRLDSEFQLRFPREVSISMLQETALLQRCNAAGPSWPCYVGSHFCRAIP